MSCTRLFLLIFSSTLLMTSCDFFKKKYEEIPPQMPNPEGGIVGIAKVNYDWKLQTLDSTEMDFSSFKGKVVFLNFWETWCGPCRVEIPKIENLSRVLKTEVDFVLVSTEELGVIRRFADSTGIELPLYRLKSDLPAMFDGPGLPRTYLLDDDGSVVFQEYRAAKWDDQTCVEFIESLANN